MVALHAALTHIQDHPAHETDPLVICTDSQSVLAALMEGPSAQTPWLGAAAGGVRFGWPSGPPTVDTQPLWYPRQ